MLLEVGVGTEIEPIEVSVLPVDMAVGVAVTAVGHVGKECTDQAGVGQTDGDLLEYLLGIEICVLASLFKFNGLLGQAVALQRQGAITGLHGIVQNDNGVGTEIGLIRELILQQRRGGIRSEIHGLIPTDTIVVNINLAQHLHHFHLKFMSVQTGGVIVETAIVPGLDH